MLGGVADVTQILKPSSGRPEGRRRVAPARLRRAPQARRRPVARRSRAKRFRPPPWFTRRTSGWSGGDEPAWENRRHFFAAAAEAMRRILVEAARRKGRDKHGGGPAAGGADLDALMQAGPDEESWPCTRPWTGSPPTTPQGQAGRAAVLRRPDPGAGGRVPEHLPFHGRSGWRYARAWLYTAMAGDASRKKVTCA